MNEGKARVMKVPVDDGGGFRPGGGHRRTAGFWSPGYPPRNPPAKTLLLRGYFRFWGGFRPGWTPKKTALTLAIYRASPASIRMWPGRNRQLAGAGPQPDSRSQRGYPPRISPASPERTTPSIPPWIASERRSVSSCDVSRRNVSDHEKVLTCRGKLTLRRTHWSARTVQTMCNLQVENDG